MPSISLENNYALCLEKACSLLQEDKVFVGPTDTVYGVFASFDSPKAKDKIYSVKNRDKTKPLQILISSIDDLQKFNVTITPFIQKVIEQYWPGALTLVLHNQEESFGFRLPQHKLVCDIIKNTNVLWASSANISDSLTPYDFNMISPEIKNNVDLVIDGGSCKNKQASSVISIDTMGMFSFFRQGSITYEDISKIHSSIYEK